MGSGGLALCRMSTVAAGPWRVGKFSITPVFEVDAGSAIQEGIPQAQPANLLGIPWLQPNFVHADGRPKAVVQSFLIEAGGVHVLVDPGVGNAKVRNDIPVWSNLNTDLLDRLPPIDIVVCTHFHFDHSGGNTKLVDGYWVPSFPAARYIFLRQEVEYWSEFPEAEIEDDRAGFRDSVMPILQAGMGELVALDYEVAPGISFLSTHGHTPGHVSVLVESNGEQAVITGDAIHHPFQMARPEWPTQFDTCGDEAQDARRALLERCVDTDTLFVGSHFAPPTAGFVRRDGDGFKLVS